MNAVSSVVRPAQREGCPVGDRLLVVRVLVAVGYPTLCPDSTLSQHRQLMSLLVICRVLYNVQLVTDSRRYLVQTSAVTQLLIG